MVLPLHGPPEAAAAAGRSRGRVVLRPLPRNVVVLQPGGLRTAAVGETNRRGHPPVPQAGQDLLGAGERHEDEESLQSVQRHEGEPQRLQVDEAGG